MVQKYRHSCGAYISEYIKKEIRDKKTLFGWYHYIDNPDFNTVGIVATAEVLILIKECNIPISFECMPMIKSLLDMQNLDGGWSFRSNIHSSATEPTARAIQALLLWEELLNEDQKQAIVNGVRWILKYKNSYNLWGPINKKEKKGHFYFSCVVLQALDVLLHRNPGWIMHNMFEEVECTINKAVTSILDSFNNNDIQCGWGSTKDNNSTIFHTAYVIYTIGTVKPDVNNRHAFFKSIEFLKEKFLNNNIFPEWDNKLNIGENEIYQFKTFRLVYTHSVDTYVVLALLQDESNIQLEKTKKYINDSIKHAEKTDWRYREFVTCWRMFDVMLLCDFYSRILEKEPFKSMNHFKIALTFAGETRELVESIANELSKKVDRKEILYDKYHEAEFARPQLDIYLQNLYHDCSDLIVVFICDDYSQKRWCGVEWRSIRDILNHFDFQRIMYVKASETSIENIELPGFYPSEDGYVDATIHTPKEIAELIYSRYESMS